MASVNKVILVGRLGRDPEVRFTGGGQAVANFSLAVDESYKDKAGEKQQKTEWVNLVVWGTLAENVVQPHLHKGDLIYAEGKLQSRKYEKDGEPKTITEVNVFSIQMLSTKGGQSEGHAAPKAKVAAQSSGDEDLAF